MCDGAPLRPQNKLVVGASSVQIEVICGNRRWPEWKLSDRWSERVWEDSVISARLRVRVRVEKMWLRERHVAES
jgi:hypothetical protein